MRSLPARRVVAAKSTPLTMAVVVAHEVKSPTVGRLPGKLDELAAVRPFDDAWGGFSLPQLLQLQLQQLVLLQQLDPSLLLFKASLLLSKARLPPLSSLLLRVVVGCCCVLLALPHHTLAVGLLFIATLSAAAIPLLVEVTLALGHLLPVLSLLQIPCVHVRLKCSMVGIQLSGAHIAFALRLPASTGAGGRMESTLLTKLLLPAGALAAELELQAVAMPQGRGRATQAARRP